MMHRPQQPPLLPDAACTPQTVAVDARTIREAVEQMSELEHHQVFHLIRQDTSKYTENHNGVFVNLAYMPPSTLNKLQRFVQYWCDRRSQMAESEARIQQLRHRSRYSV